MSTFAQIQVPSLGFTPLDVMAAGMAAKERDKDAYYQNPCTDGVWRWHASSLSSCPRQQILKRAGFGTDGTPLKGLMTMNLGTVMHTEFEQWIKDYVAGRQDVTITCQEVGFWHTDYPLAAKPDLLLHAAQSGYYLIDFKTEHEFAAKRRQDDAREYGSYTTAKRDHMIQLAATAMAIESNMNISIASGAIWYVSKNNMWVEAAPVDLSEGILREDVIYRINNLEAAWEAWSKARELPTRIDPDDKANAWACRPVKGKELGEYCSARSTCMSKGMPS